MLLYQEDTGETSLVNVKMKRLDLVHSRHGLIYV